MQSFFFLAPIFVCVYSMKLGLAAAIGSYIFSFFLANILLIRAVYRDAGGISWRIDKKYIKDIFSYGIKIYPSHIFSFLNLRAVFFLIKLFLTTTAVGLYAAAAALSEGLLVFAKSVSTVLVPRVVRENDPQKLRDFTPLVLRSVFIIVALGALFLFFIADILIKIFYSETFAAAADIFRVLLLGIPALCGWEILSGDIAGRGRQIVNSYISAAAFTVNIAANFILIPIMGILGAALAADISYLLMFIAAAVFYGKISGNNFAATLFFKRSDFALYWNFFSGMLKKTINKPD